MNIKAGYFIRCLDDAQEFISSITRREVVLLPYPMDSSYKRYYITEDGRVFFAKIFGDRAFVIERHHEKRKSSEKLIRLSTGNRKEVLVTIAQCLYNSFVLGTWSDTRPCFKNKDKGDISINNLYIPFELPSTVSIDKMHDNTRLYETKFIPICKYISYTFNLPVEDAEDIVQDAFIHITLERDTEDVLLTWIWYCKQRAKDFIHKRDSLSCFDYDPCFFNKDFEFPLYKFLPVKRDRDILEMRYKGYKNTEIAKMLSTSKGTVDSIISKSLTLIKKILKKDLEYYEKRRRV